MKNIHIQGIDGLRAVAVLSVIIFHLRSTLLPGGFTGVDVFFVISGYVVTGSLMRDQSEGLKNFLLNFYLRRVVRIYPALLFCILIVALLHTLFVPSSWLSTTASKTGLLAIFGLSNFGLIWFNDGYFSPRVEFNEFTHTWSLAVEEQFYFLFPLIFFLAGYRQISKSDRSKRQLVLPALLLSSVAYSAVQTSTAPDQAFYLLPSRFWELATGAMLFLQHQDRKLLPNSKTTVSLTLIGGLILVQGCSLLPETMPLLLMR